MSKQNKVSPSLPPLSKSQSKQVLPEAESSAINIHRSTHLQNQNYQDVPQNVSISQSVQPPQNPVFTCRICLEEHPALHANTQQQLKTMLALLQEQQKLKEPHHVITTCHCQGTAGYVHQNCMIQWIDAQYKRSKQKQMKCQICLEEILYDRKTVPYFEVTCHNLEEVSACNIACFTSVAIVLALFIVLQTQSSNLKFNQLAKLTIYVLISILIVTLGISIVMIIKQAFYKTKKQTIKVYSNDEIEIRRILKENLTHYDRRSTTYRTQTYARSVRSARNSRDIYRSRVNEPNQSSRFERRQQSQISQRNTQRQRTDRPVRVNTEQRETNQNQPIRSQRNIRSARNAMSTRSIHIRSREQIQQNV